MVVSLRNDFVQFLMLPFHICNIVMLGFYIIDLQIKLQLLFYHIFKYSKATFFPWGYRSAKSSLSVQESSNSLSDCRVLDRVRCHSKSSVSFSHWSPLHTCWPGSRMKLCFIWTCSGWLSHSPSSLISLGK